MRPPPRHCLFTACVLALLAPTPSLAAFAGPAELIPMQITPPLFGGLLKILLLLTFCLHLLLVNILVGSCMMALAASVRQKSIPAFSMKEETSFIPTVLALTVNLGVAPYLFIQLLYGSFFYSSTLLMSVWWMAIIGLVMLSYYGLYIISDKNAAGIPLARPMLAILTGMLMLTAFILSNNSTLMLRPENWLGWIFSPGGTLLNTGDPTLMPRFLHILLACAAIGGLAHATLAAWKREKTALPDLTEAKISRGLVWFRRATMAQILVGLWYFLSLPADARGLFMGGRALPTTAFVLALAGVALVFILAHRRRIYTLCAASVGLTLLMVVLRDSVRDAMLLPYLPAENSGKIAGLADMSLALEKGQGIGLAFFLVCAVLAVLILAWMTRAVVKAVRQDNRQDAATIGALEE